MPKKMRTPEPPATRPTATKPATRPPATADATTAKVATAKAPAPTTAVTTVRVGRSKSAAPPRGAGRLKVIIASPSGQSISIETGAPLEQAALEWSWAVRNRNRWATLAQSQVDQGKRACTALAKLHVDLDALDGLAGGGLIQVTVPYVDEKTAWEARVFPWEYVISAAFKERRVRKPWIVRRLLVRGAEVASEQTKPAAALFVESAPGDLRARFSFESERRLVGSNLGDVMVETIADPTPDALSSRIATLEPGLIHLAGVDSHQGAPLLKAKKDPGIDGYYMVDDRGVPEAVPAEPLARILHSSQPARLVACNFWNSAARTAVMIAAGGAEAAIGFQDQVDDALGELFYATFYRTWAAHGWRTAEAFEATLATLKAGGASLKGTGVVLWSLRDALADRAAAGADSASAEDSTESSSSAPWAVRVPAPIAATTATATITSPRDALWVEARPLERLNYALLHNNRGMFETFRIRKQVDDVVRGVEVEVVLYVGGDSYPYRTTFDMVDPIVDLRDRVRVPLTSGVFRAFRESVQSVLYVSVSCGGETIFQDTFRVTLVPVEEWTIDTAGAPWLPSFVLPRDPAVLRVVDAAYPVVRLLRLDGKPVFDGYQAVDMDRDDPYDMVDVQVRALWSAVSFEFGLRYINPPPTYSKHAQRLRTPSEVIASKSGTCIDLALLMAACLEWIEIYPVIFLLDGHAFPGYWRSEEYHQQFVKVVPSDDAHLTRSEDVVQSAVDDQVPWLLRTGPDGKGPVLDEMMSRLKKPALKAMETVMLTDQQPFDAATAGGMDELAQGFISMVDIQIARESDVTPLPMDIGRD